MKVLIIVSVITILLEGALYFLDGFLGVIAGLACIGVGLLFGFIGRRFLL